MINYTIVKNVELSTGPPGADGVVMISYTAPSASSLTKLRCAGRPATMVVKGPALVKGTPGPDVIVGDRGANMIDGAGGDDAICAGAGDDLVKGGSGDDLVRG